MYRKLDEVASEMAKFLNTMVDTCVLCESSRYLVAIWAKDLPHSAVEHIVHQVDLPPRTKQLFCLRFLLCQHKGQKQSQKNSGLHRFLPPEIFPSKILLLDASQPIPEWHQRSGTCLVISVVHAQPAMTCNHALLSLVRHTEA